MTDKVSGPSSFIDPDYENLLDWREVCCLGVIVVGMFQSISSFDQNPINEWMIKIHPTPINAHRIPDQELGVKHFMRTPSYGPSWSEMLPENMVETSPVEHWVLSLSCPGQLAHSPLSSMWTSPDAKIRNMVRTKLQTKDPCAHVVRNLNQFLGRWEWDLPYCWHGWDAGWHRRNPQMQGFRPEQ